MQHRSTTKIYKGKSCKNGHDGMRYASNGACVECNIARLSKWIDENKERHRRANNIGAKRWRQENPERYLALIENWNRSHPEYVREIGRECCRRWRKKNLEYDAARTAARHAAKIKRIPVWVNLGKVAEFYELARWLTRETGIPHHVDHIIPLRGKTVSGLHIETNLQVIPATENCRKGNRLLVRQLTTAAGVVEVPESSVRGQVV